MSPLGWVAVGIALLVAGIVLESRRQRRKYGKGTGRAMLAAGLSELQAKLQPDRKVESLKEEERKQDLLVRIDEIDGDGGRLRNAREREDPP